MKRHKAREEAKRSPSQVDVLGDKFRAIVIRKQIEEKGSPESRVSEREENDFWRLKKMGKKLPVIIFESVAKISLGPLNS